jgi:hypothetical protein
MNPFCSPWDDGGRRWRLATVGRFSQVLTTSRVTSGASPTMGTTLMRAADLCEAPGMVSLTRAATLARRRGRAAG